MKDVYPAMPINLEHIAEHVTKVEGDSSFFLLLLLGSGSTGWGGSGGGSLGGGEGLWVGKDLLDLLDLLHVVLDGDSDGSDVLEDTTDHVWGGGSAWVANTEGKASNAAEGFAELGAENLVVDGEDGWVVHLTVVVEGLDLEGVLERHDAKDGEEVSLRSADLLVLEDELLLTGDFDSALEDLALDVEGVENLDVVWRHVGTHWADPNIDWGNSAGLGWGTNAVVVDDLLNLGEGTVGEDEAGTLGKVLLESDNARNLFLHLVNSTAHEGVLAEEDLSLAEEITADVEELGGVNVHGGNNDDLVVLAEEGMELLAVFDFLGWDNLLVVHP